MKTSLARIFVKNPFCVKCIVPIKKKVMKVQNVKNVVLCPSDSLVVFNFNSANQVSEVLNTLTLLGYPPKGDNDTITTNLTPTFCKCSA